MQICIDASGPHQGPSQPGPRSRARGRAPGRRSAARPRARCAPGTALPLPLSAAATGPRPCCAPRLHRERGHTGQGTKLARALRSQILIASPFSFCSSHKPTFMLRMLKSPSASQNEQVQASACHTRTTTFNVHRNQVTIWFGRLLVQRACSTTRWGHPRCRRRLPRHRPAPRCCCRRPRREPRRQLLPLQLPSAGSGAPGTARRGPPAWPRRSGTARAPGTPCAVRSASG